MLRWSRRPARSSRFWVTKSRRRRMRARCWASARTTDGLVRKTKRQKARLAPGLSCLRGRPGLLRVLAAGLLGVHALAAAFLVLEAGDARPGALEVVLDRDVQRTAALAGEL